MKRPLPILLLLASLPCFGAPPKAAPQPDGSAVSWITPQLSDYSLSPEAKLRIFFYSEKLSREQFSLNQLQNLVKDAQQRTQNAFVAYQKVVAEEVKNAGLPEGTQVWPSLDTDDFVITPPAKKDDKKTDATAATPPPAAPTIPAK